MRKHRGIYGFWVHGGSWLLIVVGLWVGWNSRLVVSWLAKQLQYLGTSDRWWGISYLPQLNLGKQLWKSYLLQVTPGQTCDGSSSCICAVTAHRREIDKCAEELSPIRSSPPVNVCRRAISYGLHPAKHVIAHVTHADIDWSIPKLVDQSHLWWVDLSNEWTNTYIPWYLAGDFESSNSQVYII